MATALSTLPITRFGEIRWPPVTAGSGADGDHSGTIDQGDYDLWTMHFGETTPGAAPRQLPPFLSQARRYC